MVGTTQVHVLPPTNGINTHRCNIFIKTITTVHRKQTRWPPLMPIYPSPATNILQYSPNIMSHRNNHYTSPKHLSLSVTLRIHPLPLPPHTVSATQPTIHWLLYILDRYICVNVCVNRMKKQREERKDDQTKNRGTGQLTLQNTSPETAAESLL